MFTRPALSRVCRFPVLLVAALLVTACDQTEPCRVTSVTVNPQSGTIVQGASASFNATVQSTGCNPVPTAVWTTSAGSVAIVSSSGVVTGVAPGQALVTVTVGGTSGSAVVTVVVPPVASVQVTPATGSVSVGSSLALAATIRDANGNVLTDRPVTWSTSPAGIANVSASGVVIGVAVGSVTVRAFSEGVSGTASITVTPAPVAGVAVNLTNTSMLAGTTQTAIAVVLDASGNVLTGRTVTWLSTSTGVATIDASTGLITAVNAGFTTIVATSEGVSGSAVLTVTQVPVASVTVTVANTTMAVGGTQQATAELRSASNQILTGRVVTWTSSAPAIAQVDPLTGVITAVTPGVATITATSEGVSAGVVITVVTPTPTLASLTPLFVDAVFATVPITVTGTNFVANATTLSFTGTAVAAPVVTVVDPSTLTSNIIIAGGVATTGSAVTVTTPSGTSNALALTVFSVGTAPQLLSASHGGTGGGPFSLSCNLANEVATGLEVRSGVNFDQIAVRCHPVTGAARTFGALRTTATAGGAGGVAATLACPAASVMTGITGRVGPGAGGLVDQLAVICTPINGGPAFTTASAGNVKAGSVPFTITCSAGLAVGTVLGRAGTLIDQIQIGCR